MPRYLITLVVLLSLCLLPHCHAQLSNRRGVIVRVLETTNSNIPQIYHDDVTKLDYNQGVLIQHEVPNRYGSNVGVPGQTITILYENLGNKATKSLKEELGKKDRAPMPLTATIETEKWEMVITLTYHYSDTESESRTIRFDSEKAGDFMVKFSKKSFAVFCGYGDGK